MCRRERVMWVASESKPLVLSQYGASQGVLWCLIDSSFTYVGVRCFVVSLSTFSVRTFTWSFLQYYFKVETSICFQLWLNFMRTFKSEISKSGIQRKSFSLPIFQVPAILPPQGPTCCRKRSSVGQWMKTERMKRNNLSHGWKSHWNRSRRGNVFWCR